MLTVVLAWWRDGGQVLGPRTRLLFGALLVGVAAACGSAPTAPSNTGDHATHQAQPGQRSSLTTQVPDPQCPGHRGAAINTPDWTSKGARNGGSFPALAAAMLSNGNTLVIASAAPTANGAIAAEFRTRCELNPNFGQQGATRLAFPGGVSISDVLPLADGGALIAGSTNPMADDPHWLVGKLTAEGRLDQSLGHGGWSLLPWHYTATALAVTRNGDIVVAGDGPVNGASFVSEITPHGTLVPTFGVAGRTRMPPWHDGGVQGVWVEPNGDILTLVGGGNMGCWGLVAVTLTPTGLPEPGFAARFRRALREVVPTDRYGFPVFIGDITVDANGFHLVGTTQEGCVDNPRGPNSTQRVSNVAFRFDGNLDTAFGVNGVTSFAAPIAESASALPEQHGNLLLASNPDLYFREMHKRAHMLFYRLNDAGELDNHYGVNGIADILLPYKGYGIGDTKSEPVTVPVSNGQQAAIVLNRPPGDTVILMPVPAE